MNLTALIIVIAILKLWIFATEYIERAIKLEQMRKRAREIGNLSTVERLHILSKVANHVSGEVERFAENMNRVCVSAGYTIKDMEKAFKRYNGTAYQDSKV